MAKTHFIWSPEFTNYDLGPRHPLRPERLNLTHSLLSATGIFDSPDVVSVIPEPATPDDIRMVHAQEYVEVIRRIDEGWLPSNPFVYGLGTADNPIIKNIYKTSMLYTGASLCAARAVFDGIADVAFNVSGGLHHAHFRRAAGFCVFNDAAIVAKWLLKHTNGDVRIVYLDIDAHHGDGVQEAFYDDPRVLTISIHETGRTLYPKTGATDEIGDGAGQGYAVNVPLAPFTTDAMYIWAFDEVVLPLVAAFKPDFFISQLGADAHYLDPLTHLCLTTLAYEKLFARIHGMARNRWIALGGGGYSLNSVPRIWTLAMAEMAGVSLPDALPGPGGAIRDKGSPSLRADELENTRQFAHRSVEQVKELVFPYHKL
jgi:acetoin utilization protein AcuC